MVSRTPPEQADRYTSQEGLRGAAASHPSETEKPGKGNRGGKATTCRHPPHPTRGLGASDLQHPRPEALKGESQGQQGSQGSLACYGSRGEMPRSLTKYVRRARA